MRRLLTILLLCWCGALAAQSFPYHLSVEVVPGQCYDDARLIFTLTDDNGNVVQIDPQTHNAVNITQYPLYNVQYHYQNVSSGGVQYDYSNDIMLMAGTYCVGVTANVPIQGGFAQVDTTFCNVQLTTAYNHLVASALFHVANNGSNGQELSGYRSSFHCADVGRVQLQITQGSFPYEVTILDEQQDTIRHTVFYHRVNNGSSTYYANYRDYYTFDSLAIGTYSIFVSDSCGYMVPITFTIPDAEPSNYTTLVTVSNADCPDETVIPFEIQRHHVTGYGYMWYNYMFPYLDSILQYRFVNPDNDTTEWRNIVSSSWGVFTPIYDTLPNYCVIFNDTVLVQLRDLCSGAEWTYLFRFVPNFNFVDSSDVILSYDTAIADTCATHFQSGIEMQTYKVYAAKWNREGVTTGPSSNLLFRYFRCPLSYDVWALPDSSLLAHSTSDVFTGLGEWVTFDVDTTIPVHISVTDAQGCEVASKDTVFVYYPESVSEGLFWFECHNDMDDDGKNHCCDARYLWIQEHGVEADTFRRNMTLRLADSPLYDKFNFTAVRQDGVWTVTPDNPNNHSTYVEFSYEDGWRATVRDSVCLAPGRYTFEISTDCGDTTITYEWTGFYYDSIAFTSSPQYEIQQVCDHFVVTQVSSGLENYIYTIDPSVSNDEPIQENCPHACSSSTLGHSATKDAQSRNVFNLTLPGTYPIETYSYNNVVSYLYGYLVNYWCTSYVYAHDTITISFSYLDFEMASALLCDATSTTGIVSAKAVNGNTPYTYTLYDQPGATGNVIATNSTGYFDDVPMTVGQQFSVQVVDSCSTSFSVNVTAAMITQGSLLWETGVAANAPHLLGDTVHLTALTFPPPASYQWTGPNGFTSTSQEVDVVLPDSSYGGWYYLSISNGFCGYIMTDSIYITVVSPPQVIVFYDTVCQGESYSGNGFTFTAAETSVPGLHTFTRLDQTGYYADTIILHLTINPSVDTIVEVTASGSYTWHGVTYTASGAYVHPIGDCGKETLLLTVTDTLEVVITVTADTLCEGDSVTLQAVADSFLIVPPVAVGDILCTDGTTVKPAAFAASGKTAYGIVFHVDTTGAHGWAVHLHDVEGYKQWGAYNTAGADSDIVSLSNIETARAAITDFNGYGNTLQIRNAGDASVYPAAWSVDFDNGWYLPAAGQLSLLFGNIVTINQSLQTVGGTTFPMDAVFYYWSSTEYSGNYAFELVYGGDIRSDYKVQMFSVRGIRNF